MKEAPASKVNVSSEKEMFSTIGITENEAGYVLLSVQNNHSGKTETYSLLRKDWARLVSETPRLDELVASPSGVRQVVFDVPGRGARERDIFTDLRIVRNFIETLVKWAEEQS
jgi:hypothetical protein